MIKTVKIEGLISVPWIWLLTLSRLDFMDFLCPGFESQIIFILACSLDFWSYQMSLCDAGFSLDAMFSQLNLLHFSQKNNNNKKKNEYSVSESLQKYRRLLLYSFDISQRNPLLAPQKIL